MFGKPSGTSSSPGEAAGGGSFRPIFSSWTITSCAISDSNSTWEAGPRLGGKEKSHLARTLRIFANEKAARRRPFLIGLLGRLPLGLQQAAIGHGFGDLHGVEGRALAQVVGDAPEGQAVLDRDVLADAGDVGGVL